MVLGANPASKVRKGVLIRTLYYPRWVLQSPFVSRVAAILCWGRVCGENPDQKPCAQGCSTIRKRMRSGEAGEDEGFLGPILSKTPRISTWKSSILFPLRSEE